MRPIAHVRSYTRYILRLSSFTWLTKLYPEDVAQTLELAYLKLGIDPDSTVPIHINLKYFRSVVRRELYQAALDWGAIRNNQQRVWAFPEEGFTLTNTLAIHARNNWQATWRAA